MMDQVLGAMTHALNQAMRARFSVAEDMVVLSPPCGPDGARATGTMQRLALFVVSVAEMASRPPLAAQRVMPARVLELSVVCAACHDPAGYGEGLKLLAAAMDELAAMPLLHRENCPRLPAEVASVEVAAEPLSLADWQALWRMHGGQYLPSMMYRVRVRAAA